MTNRKLMLLISQMNHISEVGGMGTTLLCKKVKLDILLCICILESVYHLWMLYYRVKKKQTEQYSWVNALTSMTSK